MALVVLRGAIRGELAGHVAMEAIAAMLAFSCVGGIAGWIADYLIRDSLEQMFHARVKWYRQGMLDAGFVEPDSSGDP
jgi:hypothetical protein